MTPAARKKHLAAMYKECTQAGMAPDHWGNWKLPDQTDFRIKFKTVNVRFERKLDDGTWILMGRSMVVSQIELTEWPDILQVKIKMYNHMRGV